MEFRYLFSLYKRFIKAYLRKLYFRLILTPQLTYNDINGKILNSIKKNFNFITKINIINKQSLNEKIIYLVNYRDSLKYSDKIFRDVKFFSFFINADRSGHSLVGAILDAHPNIIISHEINALVLLKEHNFKKNKVYSRILAKSYNQSARKNRIKNKYNYNIPYEFSGKFKILNIIGDKKGSATAQILYNNPQLISRLQEIFENNLKIITVFRNPYDNIIAMSVRRKLPISQCIRLYFNITEICYRLYKILPKEQMIIINHEDLINNPSSEIEKICNFYGLSAPKDYLNIVRQIINKKPHNRRYNYNWRDEDLHKIKQFIEKSKYQIFFKDYKF